MLYPTTGTGLGDQGSPIEHFLHNDSGDWILVRVIVASIPSAVAGYAAGCTLQATDTGDQYTNKGTNLSCSFVLLDSGTAFGLPASATDASTTSGVSFQLTTSALTTGAGENITATALTTGAVYKATLGTSLTTGGAFDAALGAAVTGYGLQATTTGVYVGAGLSQLIANSATAGTISLISATGLTTGIGQLIIIGIATMTTGRFASYNNGATEVFGIGANGHIISTVSTSAPTCAITAAHGITAATITAGSTDTCGIITTTGTQDNSADSTFTITFGKTYTVAPKSITLTAANAAGAIGSSLPYIISISATAIVIGVTNSASSVATPSWYYQIIA